MGIINPSRVSRTNADTNNISNLTQDGADILTTIPKWKKKKSKTKGSHLQNIQQRLPPIKHHPKMPRNRIRRIKRIRPIPMTPPRQQLPIPLQRLRRVFIPKHHQLEPAPSSSTTTCGFRHRGRCGRIPMIPGICLQLQLHGTIEEKTVNGVGFEPDLRNERFAGGFNATWARGARDFLDVHFELRTFQLPSIFLLQ